MYKKAVFFIEGLEHKRFVEPYINIFKEFFEVEILSFEQIYFGDCKTVLIDKENLNTYLLNMKSSFFITTTPGIGNPYFPKSKAFPSKTRPMYIYVFHSLVSPNEVYSKKSFSGFDIIFSPNQIISDQLKHLITKKSKVYTTGYPLITNDYYIKPLNKNKKKVLIAPSWGKNSLFREVNLEKILEIFQSKEIQVTIRPHPMELNDFKNILNYSLATLDDNKDLNNLTSYDYLISDWSGIGIEYSLLTNKKTIYIDTPKKVRRKLKNAEKGLNLIENEIRDTAGITLKEKNFINLLNLIDEDEKLRVTNRAYLQKLAKPKFDDNKIIDILKQNI